MKATAEFLVADYQKRVPGYEYIFRICLYSSTKIQVQRQIKWWDFSIVRKDGTKVMFRSIGHEHLVCFASQNQAILKEMPILGLAAEFQQLQEATRETDQFWKKPEKWLLWVTQHLNQGNELWQGTAMPQPSVKSHTPSAEE